MKTCVAGVVDRLWSSNTSASSCMSRIHHIHSPRKVTRFIFTVDADDVKYIDRNSIPAGEFHKIRWKIRNDLVVLFSNRDVF